MVNGGSYTSYTFLCVNHTITILRQKATTQRKYWHTHFMTATLCSGKAAGNIATVTNYIATSADSIAASNSSMVTAINKSPPLLLQ